MATSPERAHGETSPLPSATVTTATSEKATDEDASGKEATAAAADVLAVISRLVGRPFLSADASKRLEKLGKMLATEAVQTTIHAANHQRLVNLGAALREAEAALDDVEDRHLRLQGLIVAHQGEKRNLVRKLLLELKCSRMKSKLEKRRRKAEGIIDGAHRRVKSVMDVEYQNRERNALATALVPVSVVRSKS